ncbi:hypothetical protein GCM10007907_06550 [Chitinimonas prasina]|uniref:DUF3108 domain-containing protein n=1 Tax=Chitinimonas prasina TaxID=1434937 RepID=A0ABQ5YA86_9NEIS|nr:DUF3108 domain-containing protein [Chitinimonas prasina]GLR11865.1 hypothetical protein GCM10007907_06550 [Chitinimonas prasina]
MRARLSPLFLIALLTSLLLHLTASLGDTLWLWWQHDPLTDTPLIQPSQRTLQGRQLADHASRRLLAGIQPLDALQVQLGLPAVPASPAPILSEATAPAAPGAPPQPIVPPPKPAAPPPKPSTPAPQAPVSPPQVAATAEPSPPATAIAVVTPPEPTVTVVPAAATAAARPVLDGPFPRQIDVSYLIKGVALAKLKWRQDGDEYEIDLLGSFLGQTYEWKSEGEVGPHGLRPKRFTEWRNRKPAPRYLVEFDWPAQQVSFGEPAKRQTAPLQEGAQDMFSAPYQFALQGSRLPDFTMQVVSGRKTYTVPFKLIGETTLTLSGIKVPTLVLSGSHEKRRFEFYLAPDWHNLPVRIRSDDGEAVQDMIAVEVAFDGNTVLARAAPRERDR